MDLHILDHIGIYALHIILYNIYIYIHWTRCAGIDFPPADEDEFRTRIPHRRRILPKMKSLLKTTTTTTTAPYYALLRLTTTYYHLLLLITTTNYYY